MATTVNTATIVNNIDLYFLEVAKEREDPKSSSKGNKFLTVRGDGR